MGSGKAERTAFPPFGNDPREDTEAVMKFYKLRAGFPSHVLKEANRAGARAAEPGKRLDLRKRFIFTCDPASARDFDDALSLESAGRGRVTLGVHIADVSHFVEPGGALDTEAYKRSFSVYFPDRVLPMLPETLSNGVCSLVPGEDRLAFSVFITFDKTGKPVARSFAKSIIRSKARFTYEQVKRVISGGARKGADAVDAKARKTILAINELAQTLRARRFADGALDIAVPETEVELDSEGMMTGLVTRPYDESHQMVEECMVAANEAVAAELTEHGIHVIARLHEPPDDEKIEMLRAELGAFGVNVGNIANRKAMARFLESIKGHPLYSTISVMVLRSMKRAVYDSTRMGHYGLAKRFYAHFTSPIRRYPDLTLHRQLADYLDGRAYRVPAQRLAMWAKHATEMEERAADAERAVAEMKKYRFLEESAASRQTIDYNAVIAKCAPYGCFVEIPELGVSGLVHISNISHRYVKFNEHDHTLSVPGGGRWRIGDSMKVRVLRVDRDERHIDFIPVR